LHGIASLLNADRQTPSHWKTATAAVRTPNRGEDTTITKKENEPCRACVIDKALRDRHWEYPFSTAAATTSRVMGTPSILRSRTAALISQTKQSLIWKTGYGGTFIFPDKPRWENGYCEQTTTLERAF
jgi:hypothetical protein